MKPESAWLATPAAGAVAGGGGAAAAARRLRMGVGVPESPFEELLLVVFASATIKTAPDIATATAAAATAVPASSSAFSKSVFWPGTLGRDRGGCSMRSAPSFMFT